MDTFEKEFRDKIERGKEFNYSTEVIDWKLYKFHDFYYVQANADIRESFKTLDQAIFYLLAQIAYWKS